ncbi:MAG: patatin-like phospholipase family protein [Pseudomonadota bacterium]
MTSRREQPAVCGASPPARRPTIGLALGGGGARGLAHLLVIEAFEELGLKPAAIAGTSIGAIFGAAYASGLSAREIRAETEDVLTRRFSLVRDLFAARAPRLTQIFNLFSVRSALLDPHALLDLVLPGGVAHDFERLAVPLQIVATDFYNQEPVVFSSGALRPAIAASMALPLVFQPVMHEGRALIDGGLVNPLPFDLLMGKVDIVVAIDVAGAPTPAASRDHPTGVEALIASPFIFERTIIREKLRSVQPDIYVEGGTSRFQVLDFLRLDEILAAAAPAKERLKAQLARVLGAETLDAVEAAETAKPVLPKPPHRRRLLGPRRGE